MMAAPAAETHMAGTSVVLVHGMWSRLQTWGETPQLLQSMGATVLPYELPQHGARFDSERELARLGIDDYVDDLVAFLRRQASPPLLVGHSMGALLALLAAARAPVQALIMVSPAPPRGGVLWSLGNLLCLLRPGLKQLAGWRAFGLYRWERDFLLYNTVPTALRPALAAGLQKESGKALAQIAFWPFDPTRATRVDWSAVRCPVSVYLGSEDRVVPAYAARVLRRLPKATLHLEDGLGHMVFDGPQRSRFFSWLRAEVLRLAAVQPAVGPGLILLCHKLHNTILSIFLWGIDECSRAL